MQQLPDGVDVPFAPPYVLTMTLADRFSVSWSRAGDGETNATWLSISEASRTDNAVVFHVKIAPLSAPWARRPQRANRPLVADPDWQLAS